MLTKRQLDLIHFLENNSRERVSIYDIIENVEGYNLRTKGHDVCPSVCKDIHTINNSDEYEKIIVIDNFEYFIADKEQAKAYLEKLEKVILLRWKRYHNIKKKYDLDGLGHFDKEVLEHYEVFFNNRTEQ